MGNRLTKIYTRTGDRGETGMADGSRIPKDHIRIEVTGDVDELNSVVGMTLSHALPEDIAGVLSQIQHQLFDLGGELSMPGYQLMKENNVQWLEQVLDKYNETLPPLKDFILPAGGPATASCHLARSVCRRAERHMVSLNRETELSPWLLQYLNRLSDLLFVLCRIIVRHENGTEVLWKNPKSRTE